jgi:hypothetical protein
MLKNWLAAALVLLALSPAIAAADGADFKVDYFPARTVDACAYAQVILTKDEPNGRWVLEFTADPVTMVCGKLPKGKASNQGGLLKGTALETWNLVSDGAPDEVGDGHRRRSLWALGPSAKRQTTDRCAEGEPEAEIACESLTGPGAAVHAVRHGEWTLAQARIALAAGEMKRAAELATAGGSEVKGAPAFLQGTTATRFKSSEAGVQTVEQFGARIVVDLKMANEVLDTVIAAKGTNP